jgi:hypothetical protein
MKTILVFHQLGLGDHIIFNGLIRYLCNSNKIILFVWERYFLDVSYMYKDLENVTFCRLFLETDEEIVHSIKTLKYDEKLLIGDVSVDGVKNQTYDVDNSKTVLFEIYEQANVPRDILYEAYIPSDEFMENKVYEIFRQLIGYKKYILLHQDPSRNLLLDEKKISRTDCILFDIGLNNFTKNFRIFHFKKVFENSEEFHGYNSFWPWLLEFWNINIPKYNHLYVRRSLNPEKYFKTKNWVILT